MVEKLKGEEDMLEREMEKEARGDEPHGKPSSSKAPLQTLSAKQMEKRKRKDTLEKAEEEAKAEVKEAEAKVKEAKAEVKEAEAKVKEAKAEVKEAEAKVTEAEAKVTEAKDDEAKGMALSALEFARNYLQITMSNLQSASTVLVSHRNLLAHLLDESTSTKKPKIGISDHRAINVTCAEDVQKLSQQFVSVENYKSSLKNALPILDRDEAVAKASQFLYDGTESRQKQSIVATLGSPGSGKTTFLHYALDKLCCENADYVPIFVSFNDFSSILWSELEEITSDKPNELCRCFVRRILYSYFTISTEWSVFNHLLGEISITLLDLLKALHADRTALCSDTKKPIFLLAIDEIAKLGENTKKVLKSLFIAIDDFTRDCDLKIILTTLDGGIIYEQFNTNFQISNGVCTSMTQSSRVVHWLELPPLSFDKTFDAFKSALRWADDTCKQKLESLRLAIAICVGHPRSLLLLLSVISKYSDQTVWFWIQYLSDLMVGKFLGDIPDQDLIHCLADCITSTKVGENTRTTSNKTYGYWLSRGSIVNSPIQNGLFIPRVPPLLLHRLYLQAQETIISDVQNELHQLSITLWNLYHHLFTCIEHRTWETFLSYYILIRLWAHVASAHRNKFPVSDNTTKIKLSQLFGTHVIYGGDLNLTIGVHKSMQTLISDLNCSEIWNSVEDFQPCTFKSNQPGFDILCKFGDKLALIENKWSDNKTIGTKFSEGEIQSKLELTISELKKISWHEEDTIWIAAVWRDIKLSLREIERIVTNSKFKGRVVVLNKEALKLWFGPMFESMPALTLSKYDCLPR